jgi:hypothetical protein
MLHHWITHPSRGWRVLLPERATRWKEDVGYYPIRCCVCCAYRAEIGRQLHTSLRFLAAAGNILAGGGGG